MSPHSPSHSPPASTSANTKARPRIGFLGLGWIGLHRLRALVDQNLYDVVAVADPDPRACAAAQEIAGESRSARSLEELLTFELEGAVIATPSALHATQALALLNQGVAVFCQKPLARTARETQAIVDAARTADRLLDCDLSYRFTEGMRRIRNCVVEGELGHVYAADLVFHNAYGPDKPWFRDASLSGGGCAIDLGTHLVDLALWTLGFPQVEHVESRLYAQGRLLPKGSAEVEDHAVARLDLGEGTVVRIACSWNLHAGCDAVIEAHFHGSRGGAALRNRDGSFYDFVAERFDGTRRRMLAEPPDDWGGRAITAWGRRLAEGERYGPAIETTVRTAAVLDAIYGR